MDHEFRPLTADDMDQLLDVRSVAYHPVEDRETAAEHLTWRMPYSLGAFRGGRLRSVTFMVPFGALLGGRQVRIGGLTGVATAPEARRGGLVAQQLRRWFADLREDGIGWSAEHPFEPTFYAKLGYQTVLNGHTLEMTPERLRASAGVTLAGDTGAEPVESASPAMSATFGAYAKRFSFALTRDDDIKDHWSFTFRRPWEHVAHFGYELEDAYAVVSVEDPPVDPSRATLKVRDMAYSSPAGRRRLFAFLAAFEGQVDRVRLHLPPGDPIALDRASYQTVHAPELQVRIVDLRAALSVLPWQEDASLTIRVVDKDCPWNDGTFDVELSGAGGATVTGSRSSDPDAALDVRALAALVTGAATPESLLADGWAEGSVAKLRPLGRALAGHPVFKTHNDHF